MTISRIKSPNWALNEKLTSTQINDLDTNVTFALDKRTGQTDTLASAISCSSGSSIRFTSGSGLFTDSGATFTVGSAATFNGTIALNGATTNAAVFNTTSAGSITMASGSTLTFTSPTVSGSWSGALSLLSGFVLTMASGSTLTLNNTVNLSASCVLTSNALASVTFSGLTTCANLKLSGVSKVGFSASRTITRALPPVLTDQDCVYTQDGAVVTANLTATDGCMVIMPVTHIPNGATITSLTVYFTPSVVHFSVPTNLSVFKLRRQDVTTGAATTIGSATDTSPNIGDYNGGLRSLTLSLSTVVDLATYRYVCSLFTESGSNAMNGMTVHGVSLTFTTTSMDEY